MSETDYINLIKQARHGDKKSFNKLAEMIRPRLYAYVYRIMLQDDVAQDIVQETLLEMFKVIGKLRKADRFWPWSRGIAYNKIRRYRSDDKRWRTVSMFNEEDNYLPEDKKVDHQAGLSSLMGEELKTMIYQALQDLKPRQRSVLVMRCYEQMEYSQIAKLMKGTELGMRVLFYRAKRTLYQRLAKNGLGKGFFLTSLVLFGKMTAPSKAAAAKLTVSAESTKVGLTAGVVGAATGKAAVMSLVTAGVIAAGVAAGPKLVDKSVDWSQQTVQDVRQQVVSNWPTKNIQLQGASESWYYYPSGKEDTVMLRQAGQEAGYSWCYQLQNDKANYSFNPEESTVYINNYRKWNADMSVWRLPTDSARLSNFISKVEGVTKNVGTVAKNGDQLIIVRDTQKQNAGDVQTFTEYNALSENYFRFDWPLGTNFVDNRDEMHKRGWTYFEITGQVNGQKVSGSGRIPFVYDAVKEHYPWIKLNAGNIRLAGRNGKFFAGLARPWTGLHTIDIVRRDAAAQQIAFETADSGGGKTEVVLTKQLENANIQMVYTINMEKDIVEKISILITDEQGHNREGLLEFSYLQEINYLAKEFAEPQRNLQSEDNGLMWLVELVQNRLTN